MQNNLAIFYCGTNGAGKTTLRGFNQDTVQIVIDSDHIAMQINPENPRSVDSQAGRKAIELFKFAVSQQISFSMESTLSGNSILQRMKTAKESGFFVRLNYVGVSRVSINIDRVKARVANGGHFIDEAIIRNRYDISLQNLVKILPLCDEVFIYDNSGETPNLIFHFSENELTQWVDKLPRWCERLEDLISCNTKRADF
ncbi:zeta toxin family protein [Rodentibacter haemolyticus]|uniref:Zeta toxin family protein n=1 Tax=Rodentibacter haemolyticus TaxID=2778911 RepID=A0ABX6V0R0_9PAST|nr:zeta toxin family protein [Rodentibacter haemolyticus]QPB43091.1 zeta toxin family protein [Rodentibacter haemolyticus]